MASYTARYGVGELVLVYPKQQRLTQPIPLRLETGDWRLTLYPLDILADDGARGVPLRDMG